ncbi:ORF58 [Felid gammaherpesvirus 1]|uniref:ORF58 n=1 Tax=Felid gammaherpesvirus 1 TaxID=2560468 RepID=A0A0M4M157_9GAMA|nr:ORF58 [Felis catus gammaherpesvirus 1]ALE14773.1 ORF58 [Felis catus gammaherpesvirus 1]
MKVVSEPCFLKTALASFLMGSLCSTMFLWCYIFVSLFTFTFFLSVMSHIYSEYILVLYAHLMIICFCDFSKKLNQILPTLGWISVIVTVLAFSFCYYNIIPDYTLPCIFIINAFLLSFWVPGTVEVIYLCQNVVHHYFEMGFYFAVIVYHGLVTIGAFETAIFLIPFCFFICVGVHAFCYFKNSIEYFNALDKRKAIFICGGDKYITFKFYEVLHLIFVEILTSLFLCTGMNIAIAATATYTTVFHVLGNYVYLMYFGTFCCGWISIPNRAISCTFTAANIVLIISLFMIEYDAYTSTFIFLISFFCYTSALNCELAILLKKLDRAVNAPKFFLFFRILCNFIVSVNLTLQKIF